MLRASILALVVSFSAPNGIAAPYEFNPVTAEVSVEDGGTLEVLAFDADGLMDGAMLATPNVDYIRVDASFGDGYVSFELALLDEGMTMRAVEMDLPAHVAEERLSTMLGFAADATENGSEEPITKRRCMVKFATIAAICGGAAVLSLGGGAVVGCAWWLVDTYCDCLPLLGYDPCN
jgi:hypothetical protein